MGYITRIEVYAGSVLIRRLNAEKTSVENSDTNSIIIYQSQ